MVFRRRYMVLDITPGLTAAQAENFLNNLAEESDWELLMIVESRNWAIFVTGDETET